MYGKPIKPGGREGTKNSLVCVNVWPSVHVYMSLMHACLSSHSHVQPIKWETSSVARKRSGQPSWPMGDVVRRKSRRIVLCLWEKSIHRKTRWSFKAVLIAKTPELLLLFLSLVFRHSPERAELWFGEGRPPSAGQLVESQPNEEKEKKEKRKEGREGLYFPDSPAICLMSRTETLNRTKSHSCWNIMAFDTHRAGVTYAQSQMEGKKENSHRIIAETHLWHIIFLKKQTKTPHATVREWRQATRSRVAQAGRHHQHSTDKDEEWAGAVQDWLLLVAANAGWAPDPER